jgi:hypothetical protein
MSKKKVLLRDVSGAREFINRVANAAEDAAIASVGRSDAEVTARLKTIRAELETDLAPLMGAEVAAELAEAFCGAVMGDKKEREALAAMGLGGK